MLTQFRGRRSVRALVVAVGAVLAVASPLFAQGPPSMPTITFPVDMTSIGTAVVAAGATLLLGYFGIKVGFSFARKLLSRLHRSV